jgi:hypothetical protein
LATEESEEEERDEGIGGGGGGGGAAAPGEVASSTDEIARFPNSPSKLAIFPRRQFNKMPV